MVVANCLLIVSPIISKLQCDRPVFLLQALDDGLEVIFGFTGNAHGISLNRGLHLFKFVPNQLGDLLGDFLANAFLEFDLLTNAVATG